MGQRINQLVSLVKMRLWIPPAHPHIFPTIRCTYPFLTLVTLYGLCTTSLPNTGNPLSCNSRSITFHRPSSFSLSTGVSLRPRTSKLFCTASSSLFSSCSATLAGLRLVLSAMLVRKVRIVFLVGSVLARSVRRGSGILRLAR